MFNLFVLNETITNNLGYNVLKLISILSVICGISVITSKNPVVSILFLIGLFFNIAGYLMMIGINFIGLSYLLVYVGAVSILFLFILMLINVRISELTMDSSNSIPLAIMIGVLFKLTLDETLPSNKGIEGNINKTNLVKYVNTAHTESFPSSINSQMNLLENLRYSDLNLVTSQVWDGVLAETSHITSIGNVIYTNYPLWLILTSVILLLAMVGAIVITIKQ